MSNQIIIKRSNEANKVPTTSDIVAGELAINLTDKKLYSSDGDSVFELSPKELLSPISKLLNLQIFGNYQTGRYYDNQSLATIQSNTETTSSNNLTANFIYLFPFYVSQSIVIDRLAVVVNNAKTPSQMKIGLYSDINNTGELTLQVPATNIDIATTGLKEITLSPSVKLTNLGLHYGAVIVDSNPTDCLRSFYPLLAFGRSSSIIDSASRRSSRVYVPHNFNDPFPITVSQSNFSVPDNNYQITYPLFIFRVA